MSGTIGHMGRVESAMLFNSLSERLIFVLDFAIESCILISTLILFSLVGVNSIWNHISE
jgi:hypothetical protein